MTRFCLALAGLLLTTGGCFSPWFSRDHDPATAISTRREQIREKLESEERPTIIAQIGSPAMLTQTRLQNIGLVTQLRGTGGAVEAGEQRDKMLDAMRRLETHQPNTVLDDPSTAMVVAHVIVGPGARKGSVLDVAIRSSSNTEISDLEHGWLLETPLMEMNNLGGQIRTGFEKSKAQGPLVTQHQIAGGEDPALKLSGVIVGGAHLLKERELGISLDSDYADAITMKAIEPAINERFTHFNGRTMVGVATPREDSYLEIVLPPKYRLDPYHFINVVLQLAFNESDSQRVARLETLGRQLREPITVRTACWQFEAMGEKSLPMLASVLDHENPEIRFYAAHSMAYLNDKRAIPVLVSLCKQEPAFRAMCLNALVVLDGYEAGDALKELMHAADPEVKYGAVLALRNRDPGEPLVNGIPVEKAGSILEVPSTGPPLVAVSLSKTPEVVIFGDNPQLYMPPFHYVNPSMIVSPNPNGGITINRIESGAEDQVIETTSDLRSALHAIAQAGGTYGDWVRFVRECHENGYYAEPFAMNPVPQAGRTYDRESTQMANSLIDAGESFYEKTVVYPSNDELSRTDSESSKSASNKSWYNPFTWAR